jgi:hypothetical protein
MRQGSLFRCPHSVVCILPGLVWPAAISETTWEHPLGALAAILGRGKIRRHSGIPYLKWLARQFGEDNPSWGALRRLGEDEPQRLHMESSHKILCADPISLGFTRDALLVHGPQSLSLAQTEVDALLHALNTEFIDLGTFHAASPERWYLDTTKASAIFHPLSDVVGRPVALFAPEGEQAREWNRIANEIQVVMHAHPVNQARVAQGLQEANALWFWGQDSGQALSRQLPAERFISTDPLVRGLARKHGVDSVFPHGASASFEATPGTTWWHDGSLYEATQRGDFSAWIKALERINTELLDPVWHAWRQGRLQSISVLAPGDKSSLIVTLGQGARLAFWRRPMNLDRLMKLLQPPVDTITSRS